MISGSRRGLGLSAGLVLGVSAAITLLSACGSSGGSGGAAGGAPGHSHNPLVLSSSANGAPNPVAILRRISECKVAPGAAVGDTDIYGDRMAECTIPDANGDTSDGNQVTVYTNSDVHALAKNTRDVRSTDGTKRIVGPNFVLEVTGTMNLQTNGTTFFVSPAHIAREVGGQLN